jgi:hypothetical protein
VYYFNQNQQIFDEINQGLIPVIQGQPNLTRQRAKEIFLWKLDRNFEIMRQKLENPIDD